MTVLGFKEYIAESVIAHLKQLGYKHHSSENLSGVSRTWLDHPAGGHSFDKVGKHLKKFDKTTKSSKDFDEHRGTGWSVHQTGNKSVVISRYKKNKAGAAEKRGIDADGYH